MHSDTEYFQRQATNRMHQLQKIKSDIEVKSNMVKGRDRDHFVRKRKPHQTMEDKFKDHCQTFTYFKKANISKFNEILADASNVCEELLPSISRIRAEDRKLNMKWLFLKKNYETNLDVNTENWQTDQHYLAIKERLINMQQEKQLPDYYKFCLINSRDTMSRMNRSNQEIKDTRLLYAMSNKMDETQLKSYLEKMLKKYQRIRDNQELIPNGKGWKLVNKKNKIPHDEDELLIKAHMREKKPVTSKEELKEKSKLFIRQLNLENKRKQYYQANTDSNEIMRKFQKRIFKTEGSNKEIQYNEMLKEAMQQIDKNDGKIQQFKQNYKQTLCYLNQQHQQNYKSGPILSTKYI